MNTALSRALDGKEVAATAAPKALTEAAEKINKLKETLGTAKQNAGAAVDAGIAVVETMVVLGVSGAAEGMWPDKMKIAKVPVRGALGVVGVGWGIANTVMGRSGAHQLTIGQSLLGAEAYAMGREAAIAYREKQAAGSGGTPTPAQQQLLNANAGAKLLNGKVVNAQGVALEGDDLSELARLVRMQAGTAGERELVHRRPVPEGAPRRANRAPASFGG